MKNRHIYLLQWLLCSILTVLCSACSSGDAEVGAVEVPHKQATLAIYVYAPEQASTARKHAAPTRANEGEVDATIDEGTIDSLQIWIFESATGNYVGYFSTKDVTALNEGQGSTYQIPVSDDFARNKPDVNVYVMANVTSENCGVEPLDKNTTRTNLLNGAKIANGYFGLEQNVRDVPEDGLPFAGRLTAQPVVGDAPTLRIGTLSAVSTVQLTRAVSKLRFVFAKTTGQATVKITSIKINAGMIPNEEYLFQTPASMTYNAEAVELLSTTITDIAATDDPTKYLYLGQDAQEYENLINEAANKQEPEKPEVTVEGPIYLRESDKQLAGTITYKIGDAEPKTVDFAMQQAGDFKRNHTWIVYAYYAGAGKLQVQSLYVKEWSTKEMNHQVYNW